MNHYEAINDVLVNLFNEILDLEERALITPEYKNISVNDMHIMDAVGIREQKNMSTVARALNVTVGTLTIAVNNLVKKGYIQRVRSEEDRRVVLISLTEKGEKAFCHHRDFHEKMVLAILKDLNVEEPLPSCRSFSVAIRHRKGTDIFPAPGTVQGRFP